MNYYDLGEVRQLLQELRLAYRRLPDTLQNVVRDELAESWRPHPREQDSGGWQPPTRRAAS